MNKEQVIEWVKQTVAVDEQLKANNNGLSCTQWELNELSPDVLEQVWSELNSGENSALCLDVSDNYRGGTWCINLMVEFGLNIYLKSVKCQKLETVKYVKL